MVSNDMVKVQNANEACTTCTKEEPMVHYIPKVDIWEDENAMHLTAVMPGVKSEDVKITLENNKLRIYGRSTTATPKDMQLIYSEYDEGDYERVFTLSERVDRSNISAEVSAGILRVDFPKAPESRPVQIAVKAG